MLSERQNDDYEGFGFMKAKEIKSDHYMEGICCLRTEVLILVLRELDGEDCDAQDAAAAAFEVSTQMSLK